MHHRVRVMVWRDVALAWALSTSRPFVEAVSLGVIGDIEPAPCLAEERKLNLLVHGSPCAFLQSPSFGAVLFRFGNHDTGPTGSVLHFRHPRF